MYAGRALGRDPRLQSGAARPGRLFGDPARGSYLATYWLLPGSQAEWDDVGRARVRGDATGAAVRRVASTCTPRSTACTGDVRADGAPAPATALDHGFAGVIAVATTGDASALDA